MKKLLLLAIAALALTSCQKEDIVEDDMMPLDDSGAIENSLTAKTTKILRELPYNVKIKAHKESWQDYVWYPALNAKTTIGWTGASARTWVGNMTDAKQWTSKSGVVYRTYHYRGGWKTGQKEPLVFLMQELDNGDWIFRGISWRDGDAKVALRSNKQVYTNKYSKFQIWTKITKFSEILTSFLYRDRYIVSFEGYSCLNLKMGEDGMKGQPNVDKYFTLLSSSPKDSHSGNKFQGQNGAIGGKCK